MLPLFSRPINRSSCAHGTLQTQSHRQHYEPNASAVIFTWRKLSRVSLEETSDAVLVPGQAQNSEKGRERSQRKLLRMLLSLRFWKASLKLKLLQYFVWLKHLGNKIKHLRYCRTTMFFIVLNNNTVSRSIYLILTVSLFSFYSSFFFFNNKTSNTGDTKKHRKMIQFSQSQFNIMVWDVLMTFVLEIFWSEANKSHKSANILGLGFEFKASCLYCSYK